jgi:hypothetical protein
VKYLLLLLPLTASAQCVTSTDTLVSNSCEYIDAIPAILPGDTYTHCWVLVSESDNVQPGFLLVQSPGCGAVAYSSLSYEIWNEQCDSLYGEGVLWPFPQQNPTAYLPDTSINYLMCATWVAGCIQDAFCMAYQFSPLPVTLLSFAGEQVGTGVSLKWATGSEHGSSHFIIRKSVDCSLWESVWIVPAAGESQQLREYTATDRSPVSGVNYYSITEVDANGEQETFRTIAVMFNGSSPTMDFLYWYSINGQRIR